MPTSGKAHAAPPGSRGFDTDTALSATTAGAFAKAGFTFAIRYLSLDTPEAAGDLTADEVHEILKAGLALMAVQHAPAEGWWPSAALGQQYGGNAAQNAQTAGLPARVNLWLDLEGVNPGAPASGVTSFCNAWFAEVSAAGYTPGLYLGYDSNLESADLDSLETQYYWRSGSDSGASGSCFDYPYPANGFCLVQSIDGEAQLDQVSYDGDVTQADNLGNTPIWMAARAGLLPERHPHGSQPAPEDPAVSNGAGASKKRPVRLLVGIAAAAILMYGAGVVTGPLVRPLIAGSPARPEKPSTAAAVPAKTAKPPAPAPAVVPVADTTPSRSVVAGSFSDEANAARLAQTLESAGFGHAAVSQVQIEGRLWHTVRLGPYQLAADAERTAGELREKYGLRPSIQAPARPPIQPQAIQPQAIQPPAQKASE